ncbi:hypothetical protein PAPYR_1515 [Paratrimastix pyriformis]|uniref:SbsA Ig-like domain-containing protein n=1 Tax=Paratrimastix pyriformis TaxID=342808 RepID=A0ABQ8UTU9_9EUKA|nr:hypothetical protein PAPYR_1515 [Paratrimastix pyriformis]
MALPRGLFISFLGVLYFWTGQCAEIAKDGHVADFVDTPSLPTPSSQVPPSFPSLFPVPKLGRAENTDSDTTPPFVLSEVFTSSNGLRTRARCGDTVTYSFTASEPLLTPGTIFIGTRVGTVSSVSTSTWEATLTVSADDDVAWPLQVRIVGAADLAGNVMPTYLSPRVIDHAFPSAALLGISSASLVAITLASDSAVDPTRARAGDTITVSFTAEEPLLTSSLVVTIAGRAANLTASGPTAWVARLVVGPGDPEGPVGFAIVGATDLAGNALPGLPFRTATSGPDTIDIDLLAPGVTSLLLVSSNPAPRFARVGDTVTLTLTASEPLRADSLVVTLAGRPAFLTGAGTLWRANITMREDDAEGAIGYAVLGAADLAGNPLAGLPIRAGTSWPVVFDRTPPQLASIALSTTNLNVLRANREDTLQLAFVALEPLGQPPTVLIGGRPAEGMNLLGANGPVGESWYFKLSMSDPAIPGGPVGFLISNVVDRAGNRAPDRNSSTAGYLSTIFLDVVPPRAASLTVSSTNPHDPSLARAGDRICVALVASEALRGQSMVPAVTLLGTTVLMTGGPVSWSACATVGAACPEGPAEWFLVAAYDLAGNAFDPLPYSSPTSGPDMVVIDRTAPQIMSALATTSNPLNGSAWAGPADTVRLAFDASEPLRPDSMAVTIAGRAAVLSGGPLAWQAEVEMGLGDPEGPVSFLIAGGSDLAGNPLEPVAVSSVIRYDRTPPALATASLRATRPINGSADPCAAPAGSLVEVTLTASEPLSACPGVTLGSLVGSPTACLPESGLWRATFRLPAGLDQLRLEDLRLAEALVDRAGNAAILEGLANASWVDGCPVVSVVSQVFECRQDADCQSSDPAALCSLTAATASDGRPIDHWRCLCADGSFLPCANVPIPIPPRPTPTASPCGRLGGRPVLGLLFLVLCGLLVALIVFAQARCTLDAVGPGGRGVPPPQLPSGALSASPSQHTASMPSLRLLAFPGGPGSDTPSSAGSGTPIGAGGSWVVQPNPLRSGHGAACGGVGCEDLAAISAAQKVRMPSRCLTRPCVALEQLPEAFIWSQIMQAQEAPLPLPGQPVADHLPYHLTPAVPPGRHQPQTGTPLLADPELGPHTLRPCLVAGSRQPAGPAGPEEVDGEAAMGAVVRPTPLSPASCLDSPLLRPTPGNTPGTSPCLGTPLPAPPVLHLGAASPAGSACATPPAAASPPCGPTAAHGPPEALQAPARQPQHAPAPCQRVGSLLRVLRVALGSC